MGRRNRRAGKRCHAFDSGGEYPRPAGADRFAEKTILIDSLAIMLAIVLQSLALRTGFGLPIRRHATCPSGPIRDASSSWSGPSRPLRSFCLAASHGSGRTSSTPWRQAGSGKPSTIQAVSLDWKWLFIYPDQNIATINTLTVPAGVPLQFQLTWASVMNVFLIPQFGSMIYTMNGRTTRLNLRADSVGTFGGLAAHFSGDGFSDMHFFDVHVVPPEEFSKWVQDASHSEKTLDAPRYEQIAKPSMKDEPAIYRLADPDLFQSIAMQKIRPSPGAQTGVGASPQAGVADAR